MTQWGASCRPPKTEEFTSEAAVEKLLTRLILYLWLAEQKAAEQALRRVWAPAQLLLRRGLLAVERVL